MGIFDRKNVSNSNPVAPASKGGVSLAKGQKVSLSKGSNGSITVSNGWTARGKDYDLKALVRYHDGRQVYIGAANRDELLKSPEGAVIHGGDARNPGELETITISWHPDIASVALSSYSALENGRGSFREYGVYVKIENGSDVVSLSAEDASSTGNQYTLCFGEVVFEQSQGFTVSNLELYSKKGSEKRIGYEGNKVVMDIGPEGKSK